MGVSDSTADHITEMDFLEWIHFHPFCLGSASNLSPKEKRARSFFCHKKKRPFGCCCCCFIVRFCRDPIRSVVSKKKKKSVFFAATSMMISALASRVEFVRAELNCWEQKKRKEREIKKTSFQQRIPELLKIYLRGLQGQQGLMNLHFIHIINANSRLVG